jgi:acetyl esterase/lipase
MTRYLILGFLLTMILAGPAQSGLVTDSSDPSAAAADATASCTGVTFTRQLKYRENEQNVLDVATADFKEASSRPVLLFVAGENFAGENGIPDFAGPLQDAAMCFAARYGMVGVRIAYQLAPANPWPGGARDVAAAISWVRENIDLFRGNPDEIVAIGYATGASHVATYLAHPEFQVGGPGVAGVILVSGLYRAGPDANAAEKAYFGNDPSQYEHRSAFPGILHVEAPVLLAWSALDPPHLIAQGEKLREFLCSAPAHCPHTTVLKERLGLSSVFGLDATGGNLVEATLELIREIEARGLP